MPHCFWNWKYKSKVKQQIHVLRQLFTIINSSITWKFSNYLFSTQAKTLRPPQSFPCLCHFTHLSVPIPLNLCLQLSQLSSYTSWAPQTFLILMFGNFFRSKSHSLDKRENAESWWGGEWSQYSKLCRKKFINLQQTQMC